MDKIIPSECDVRIKIEKDAQWRRISHINFDDMMYLELNSQPQHPVTIDLVSQRIRLLVFPGRFMVMKLDDEEAIMPSDPQMDENPLPKWSDHCDDTCSHCGEHTGRYARTYRWNMLLMDCPHCGQTSISGMGDDGVFRWFKLKKGNG